MLTDKKVQKILLEKKLLDENGLTEAIQGAKKAKQKLLDYIIDKSLVAEIAFYESAAKFLGIPFVSLDKLKIRKDLLFLIPEVTAQKNKTVIFDVDDKKKRVKLATLDPNNLEIFEFIKKKTGLKPDIHLCTKSGLEFTLKQYHKDIKADFQIEKEKKHAGSKELKKMSEELPIVKIVDSLLEQAFYEGASDIHIEPGEKETEIRYRIDGILSNIMTLPKKAQSSLIARIKVLANLKVDEHRMPQDGRFKIYNKKNKISFRVSIIPTLHGEKVVMRLLEEKPKVLSLKEIGLHPRALEKIENNIKKPNGMILVTGPTGSGKTTTLYTILNILNTPKVNISTIEDPIEYNIPHVNQSQIQPKIGYTFAKGLRAFLRQDPDIIMVGEIRDNETAEIAIHAALTGHLVLSTLHTNDALKTLPRILEMDVPPFLVASTTNLIIAQRLTRRICKSCITSYYLHKDEIEQLKREIDTEKILHILRKEKIISDKEKTFDKLLFYKGKGCPKCGNTGYKGRTGLYEALEITPGLSKLIAQGAKEAELREEANKQDMLKLIEDGFIKAKSGITTIEEVLRVTKE